MSTLPPPQITHSKSFKESTTAFEEATVFQKEHGDPELHLIGDSLPSPSLTENIRSLGDVGTSSIPAREDHVHGIGSATFSGFEGTHNSFANSTFTNLDVSAGASIGGGLIQDWRNADNFEIPENGTYEFGIWLEIPGTSPINTRLIGRIINNSTHIGGFYSFTGIATSQHMGSGVGVRYLEAGQIVTWQAWQSTGAAVNLAWKVWAKVISRPPFT